MCTCKYVEKERDGALFASNLLCNELHDSCRKESQNLYTEATIYQLMYCSFSIYNI